MVVPTRVAARAGRPSVGEVVIPLAGGTSILRSPRATARTARWRCSTTVMSTRANPGLGPAVHKDEEQESRPGPHVEHGGATGTSSISRTRQEGGTRCRGGAVVRRDVLCPLAPRGHGLARQAE